jgi:outer membrane protein OmpU
MKKVLLASTALLLSAGFAAAEVSVGGSARMGVVKGFSDDTTTVDFDESDVYFSSRVRVEFTLSGATDNGLEFGASIRADNASDGAKGDAGSVFLSGAFGKLSMGDVDGAANAAVGHVSGVGYTGLGDLNESTFIANGDGSSDPSMLYEYTAGDLTFYLSATNPGVDAVAVSAAVAYTFGDYSVALGYEDNDAGTDHIILGGNATFGPATVKARWGTASGAVDGDQWALSLDYTTGAITGTAFYADDSELGGAEAWGLGGKYDLGGGAAVKAGYVSNETDNTDSYDLGVTFSF